MGKAFSEFTTRKTVIIAAGEAFLLLIPLIFVSEVLFLSAAAAILVTLGVAIKFARFSTEKIGGVTGDIYGAVTILAEMFALIIFLFIGIKTV